MAQLQLLGRELNCNGPSSIYGSLSLYKMSVTTSVDGYGLPGRHLDIFTNRRWYSNNDQNLLKKYFTTVIRGKRRELILEPGFDALTLEDVAEWLEGHETFPIAGQVRLGKRILRNKGFYATGSDPVKLYFTQDDKASAEDSCRINLSFSEWAELGKPRKLSIEDTINVRPE